MQSEQNPIKMMRPNDANVVGLALCAGHPATNDPAHSAASTGISLVLRHEEYGG